MIQPSSTDAAFNLAQTLHTLGEYIFDGTITKTTTMHTAPQYWLESRNLLQQVMDEQRQQLTTAQAPDSIMDEEKDDDDADDAAAAAEETLSIASGSVTNMDSTAAAVEEQVVTASTVIETVLAAIDVDISLLTSAEQDVTDDIDSLLRLAQELDSRDNYMELDVQKARHNALRAVIEQIQQQQQPPHPSPSSSSTSPNLALLDSIIQEQQEILSSERRPSPADMSELADSLVLKAKVIASAVPAGLPTYAEQVKTALLSIEPILKQAEQLYKQARSVLSTPLGRPSSIAGHHVPSLLASNATSLALVHLALSIVTIAAYENPRIITGLQLREAEKEALGSLDVLQGPFKQASGSNECCPRFAITPKTATGPREDCRTISGLTESALTIFRTQLFGFVLFANQTCPDPDRKAIQALLKGVWPNTDDLRRSVEGYLSEAKDDLVGRVVRFSPTGVTEDAVWARFLSDI